MTTNYPRQQIAEQISDLRQMRARMSDMISAACGLLAQGEAAQVPDMVRLELLAALSHAEKADKIAQDRMKELYAMPTPTPANTNTEEAA